MKYSYTSIYLLLSKNLIQIPRINMICRTYPKACLRTCPPLHSRKKASLFFPKSDSYQQYKLLLPIRESSFSSSSTVAVVLVDLRRPLRDSIRAFSEDMFHSQLIYMCLEKMIKKLVTTISFFLISGSLVNCWRSGI